MPDKFTDYTLPETGYITFDAESLKQMIIGKLQAEGTFTDQVYEGSNMSAFIDVIAYSYHVLMYYLNRTSAETMFTESNIYENINRIVKLLSYNPVGFQTSSLTFNMFATEDMPPGTYTIPRYSYLNANGVAYSFDRDISFVKNTNTNEPIDIVGDKYMLYQGLWKDRAPSVSSGEPFENMIVANNADDNTSIDHFHIHVYVQDSSTGQYFEHTEVSSLYNSKPSDRVFEKRLNENGSYEIKFGNNITGQKLKNGDIVYIFYLESLGEGGIVGPSFLNNIKLVRLGTTLFSGILADIKPVGVEYISYDNMSTIYLTNDTGSTSPQARESVSEIKRKAPLHFTAQDRLVTLNDYATYLEKNFGGILNDSRIIDHATYMDEHFKYIAEDVGVIHPDLESRLMYNQLNVTTTTNFNNIYVYCVPRISITTSVAEKSNFLTQSQRELIRNSMNEVRMVSQQPVIMDPVYVAVNFACGSSTETPTAGMVDNTEIVIKKELGNIRDSQAIQAEISNLIISYFKNTNMKLGQTVNLNTLGAALMDVDGVTDIVTRRTDTGLVVQGLSICIWNPVYDTDITISTQNVTLPGFKFPYLHNSYDLISKIVVE